MRPVSPYTDEHVLCGKQFPRKGYDLVRNFTSWLGFRCFQTYRVAR